MLGAIFSPSRHGLALLVMWGFIAASGCNKAGVGKTVPVSGKVNLGGEPLTQGVVTFVPNPDKGNTSKFVARGMISSDGKYTLTTKGKEGAPLGWYKVTVSTEMPPDADAPKGKDASTGKEKVTVDRTYTSPKTTNLFIEVVEDPQPRAYDLNLKK
jgi:hypothetical protein